MAAATIHVDVVSAEESIFSGEAEFVVLPGEAGQLGIYPRHTPLITRIRPGTVEITPAGGGEKQLIFVAGGAFLRQLLQKALDALGVDGYFFTPADLTSWIKHDVGKRMLVQVDSNGVRSFHASFSFPMDFALRQP